MEDVSYAGVRARFSGHLGKALIPMQVDAGFGDALVLGPSEVTLPSLQRQGHPAAPLGQASVPVAVLAPPAEGEGCLVLCEGGTEGKVRVGK